MKQHSKKRRILFWVLNVLVVLLTALIAFFVMKLYKKESADTIQKENVRARTFDERPIEMEPDEDKKTIISETEMTGEADQENIETEHKETEEILPEDTGELLSKLTLEEKIAQMFFVTPEALTGVGSVTAAGETTRNALNRYPVGGIVYFSNNIVSEEQFSEMVLKIQSYSMERIGLPLFIGVDEEGGTVYRITRRGFPNVPDIPDMLSIGKTGDTQKAYETGTQIGKYLERFQVNVDFAPVADVYTNENNTVIGTRSFGQDANLVAAMVEQEVIGLQEQNIAAVLKHFPGHGDTSQDSHSGMASSSKTLDELRSCEWIPFRSGIDAGASFVMVGHISYPNILESDIPASISYTMTTEILRQELGFEGIIITDAMNMGAIANRYDSADAAVRAVQAGVDIILMPNDFQAAYEGLLNAVREGIVEESRIDDSVRRILEAKCSL
ncbi:MAG: glycoside hydrolase family 3 protein [Clostridiales bacterium]|nr:glycoside hydrolase family 3 protein [Clostridiales bacterium]